ncbi:MAG: class I tRNA ligase family protein, partial [Myxococcales bacterium]|nr:class I tRNA ligase family protein [Myxococcales bacterium]
ALNDALSNWYVRRSRGRFWSEGDSADKAAAFATLYEVLVDFTGLIAPFVPFVAETMYRNLVTKADPKAPESVHLAAFPQPQSARKNDLLRTDMALVRNVVSLGQRVRTERKLKVRQPLGQAIVVVDTDAERDSIARFSDAIREELNIHELTFTKEPGKYVEFQLVPNFRALGPKLGKQMPACKKALATADASALREQLEKNGSIELALPDGNVTLDSDDIEVRLTAKDDFAAASSGGLVLILDTRLTDELRAEGLAREVINRVQRARKSMDLAHEARIAITYQAEGALADAVAAHGETIARET